MNNRAIPGYTLRTMIEELLQCRCGHGISGHSGAGCEGERFRPCACRRSSADVLESAIHHVTTEPPPPAVPVAARPV
jgi:hypothetical protein